MINKIRAYINASENKKILSFIVVLAILAALPLTVIISQKQQQIRQRAQEAQDYVYFQTAIEPDSLVDVKQGMNFEIDLINTKEPKSISSLQIDIKYNANLLEYTSYDLKDLSDSTVISTKDGLITYLWAPQKLNPSDKAVITLVTLKFIAKTKDVGKSEDLIQLSEIIPFAVDPSGKQSELQSNLPDGKFSVVPKAPTPIPTQPPKIGEAKPFSCPIVLTWTKRPGRGVSYYITYEDGPASTITYLRGKKEVKKKQEISVVGDARLIFETDVEGEYDFKIRSRTNVTTTEKKKINVQCIYARSTPTPLLTETPVPPTLSLFNCSEGFSELSYQCYGSCPSGWVESNKNEDPGTSCSNNTDDRKTCCYYTGIAKPISRKSTCNEYLNPADCISDIDGNSCQWNEDFQYCDYKVTAVSTPTPTKPQPTPTPTLTSTPAPIAACTACSADVNKDGVADIQDLSLINLCLGKPISGKCANADINKDGKIDTLDTACVGQNFNKSCPQQVPASTATSIPVTVGVVGECPADRPLKTQGNANCDGNIDILDFNIWRDEFAEVLASKTSDFNSDGKITIVDFSIWRDEFLK